MPAARQVSDHLEFSREDSDEQKTAALASVMAVGEAMKVKVVEVAFDERCACRRSVVRHLAVIAAIAGLGVMQSPMQSLLNG